MLIAQLNDGRYRGDQVLSAAGVAALHAPLVYPDGGWHGYAMGLWVGPLWEVRLADVSGPNDAIDYRVPVILEHGGDVHIRLRYRHGTKRPMGCRCGHEPERRGGAPLSRAAAWHRGHPPRR